MSPFKQPPRADSPSAFRRLKDAFWKRLQKTKPPEQKRRARRPSPATLLPTQTDSLELDKILTRIRALHNKTVSQGCTEAEALAAAAKVAELLDRYGLSLSEAEIKKQSCDREDIPTGRQRRGALDDCVGAIAQFCDCRCWYEKMPGGQIRHIFFGLPADVAGARYLYERIEAAFESETHSFKQSLLYNTHSTGRRRGATTSFQLGLRDGICGKLSQLKQARATSTRQTSGRDLVPVKKALIDTEFAALGLTLRRAGTRGNRVLPQAYEVGKRSGERLEWEDRIRE